MAALTLHHFSQTLGMGMTLQIILPETSQGIGVNPSAWDGKTKLPVLYLLHGRSDDETIWQRRTSIERYVSQRKLAVVMPTTHLAAYTNQVYGRRYFDYISQEVPALCQSYFNISGHRDENYIAGLSMGGYGALKIGLSLSDRFSHVIALSASVDRTYTVPNKFKDFASIAQLKATQNELPPEDYETMMQFMVNFGSLSDYLASEQDNLFRLATKKVREEALLPRLFLFCGENDSLLTPNRQFHNHLCDLGVGHEYGEAPGAHEWSFWDEHIQRGLDWLPQPT